MNSPATLFADFHISRLSVCLSFNRPGNLPRSAVFRLRHYLMAEEYRSDEPPLVGGSKAAGFAGFTLDERRSPCILAMIGKAAECTSLS